MAQKQVLLIDSEATTLLALYEMLEATLTDDAYAVKIALHLREALACVGRDGIDVLVLNTHPADNGEVERVLRRAWSVNPATRCIVLSAAGAMLATAEEEYRRGATFLSAPWSQAQLAAFIGQALVNGSP